MAERLLEVTDLKMYFPVISGGLIPRKVRDMKAVDGVSFSVDKGGTLGLVGESGSGKTTVGLCLLQLYRPTGGQVVFRGQDLCKLRGEELRQTRRHMQVIFQDPYGSLNPRMNAADTISEPLRIHRLMPKEEYGRRVDEILTLVGLDPRMARRYPHEFSAGERQRLGIARALAVGAEFIVCDEPVSSLDVCVQAQILNLLQELQTRLDLTYLFIAHDLAVVGYVASHVAVMYRGRFVETGTRAQIYDDPRHPYTRSLLEAIPIPDREVELKRKRTPVKDASVAAAPPEGCSFRPVCAEADETCQAGQPVLVEVAPGHRLACWRAQ